MFTPNKSLAIKNFISKNILVSECTLENVADAISADRKVLYLPNGVRLHGGRVNGAHR